MRLRRWAVVTRDTAGNVVLAVWPCWTRRGAVALADRWTGNLVRREAERRP